MSHKFCEERITDALEDRLEDLRLLYAGYMRSACPVCDGEDENCPVCSGTGTVPEDVPDLGNFWEYGLCFDYVAPGTFTGQSEGYFRYQLSWGGPSDEFRFFVSRARHGWSIYRIEFWFLDWYDGASRRLYGTDRSLLEDIFALFDDTGVVEQQYNKALDE